MPILENKKFLVLFCKKEPLALLILYKAFIRCFIGLGEPTMTKLTAAQALVRYLAAQRIATDDGSDALFGGVWAIFGHGNVAGLGDALYAARDALPTFRAHNEQAMAHAAIAYAKAQRRRRMMACTTSIGPGALNMVTAAAPAHPAAAGRHVRLAPA